MRSLAAAKSSPFLLSFSQGFSLPAFCPRRLAIASFSNGHLLEVRTFLGFFPPVFAVIFLRSPHLIWAPLPRFSCGTARAGFFVFGSWVPYGIVADPLSSLPFVFLRGPGFRPVFLVSLCSCCGGIAFSFFLPSLVLTGFFQEPVFDLSLAGRPWLDFLSSVVFFRLLHVRSFGSVKCCIPPLSPFRGVPPVFSPSVVRKRPFILFDFGFTASSGLVMLHHAFFPVFPCWHRVAWDFCFRPGRMSPLCLKSRLEQMDAAFRLKIPLDSPRLFT